LLTPTERVRFFKIKSIWCRILYYSGDSSFLKEDISALGAATALFAASMGVVAQLTPTPGLLFVIVFITHTADMLLQVIKSEPRCGSCSPICPHTAAPRVPAAPIQSYPECKKEPRPLPVKAAFVVMLKTNLRLLPLPLPHRSSGRA
jgi:hypothetical protein